MSSQYRNQKKKRTETYILIGDGFDELEVVYLIHKFRQAGLPIKSVSLFNKLVFSRQGVGLKADYALADQPFDPLSDCLLVLPSGGRNGEMLRRDARVKTLLQMFNLGQGSVAITDGESILADDVGQVMTQRPTYGRRHDEEWDEFVDTLADRVSYAVA